MNKIYLLLICAALPFSACAQPGSKEMVVDADFDQVIRSYLSFTVPVISVPELVGVRDQVLLLDAREKTEFEVSHIPGAQFVGFKDFDEASVSDIPKDQAIVVYCSIGYRSEKIGEKLQKLGFNNVQNLYGSVFEWVNQGHVVESKSGPTNQIHTYNKKWGQWVVNPDAQKTTKK